MFCTKCGAQNDNGAKFCIKCGEKLETTAVTVTKSGPTALANLTQDKRKLITVIAGALAVILLFSLVFGGRGWKKTASKFMEAFTDLDAKGMVEMMPDELLEKALEEEGYSKSDLKFLIAELQDELDASMSIIGMYGDIEMDYKILGAQDVSREDLADLKEMYSELGIKVSGAKEVEVEMTVEVMGMSQTETLEIVVIKIGRSWYIEVDSMGSLL